MSEYGGHHAKVMVGQQTRLAFIGSANFTQSSQCNVEMTVKLKLTPSGLQRLLDWFDQCWDQGIPFVLSSGSRSGPGPSRSPTRARSRGAPRYQYQPPTQEQ